MREVGQLGRELVYGGGKMLRSPISVIIAWRAATDWSAERKASFREDDFTGAMGDFTEIDLSMLAKDN